MLSWQPSNLARVVPSTRYQGSKRRILPWIYEHIRHLKCESVLDGFGGTASVAYLFKLMGKRVTYNDNLLSNYQTGLALIENDHVKLTDLDLSFLLRRHEFVYPSFVQHTFKGIYYTDTENVWLDRTVHNIRMLVHLYRGDTLRKKRALAYHALFQACLCKRPFNLFHRRNLYLRETSTKRTFGNKTTWDTGFPPLFKRYSQEASNKVFPNGQRNRAICMPIMNIDGGNFDLVYLDPPYARPGEDNPIDYYSLYHFLEGIVDYENWPSRIDWSTVNRRLLRQKSQRESSRQEFFKNLFEEFQNSTIVVSYGHPGNPSISTIRQLLGQFKSKVSVRRKEYAYALNRRNGEGMQEVLIIGT